MNIWQCDPPTFLTNEYYEKKLDFYHMIT